MKQQQMIMLAASMLICMFVLTPHFTWAYNPASFASDINQGPYVDKLSFKVIANQDLRV